MLRLTILFLSFTIMASPTFKTFAQSDSQPPSRRRFLKMFAGAGALAPLNPRILIAGDYALPNSAVADIWAEIYERNIYDGVMDYESFLNQMRGLEAAVGRSMKPVVRDLITSWQEFQIQQATITASQKASEAMIDHSLKTLEQSPRPLCQQVYSPDA